MANRKSMCPGCKKPWDNDVKGPEISWCLRCAPSPLNIPKRA